MTASRRFQRSRFSTLISNLCSLRKARSISRTESGTTLWSALLRSSSRTGPMSRRSASTASTCSHVNMTQKCSKRNSTSSRMRFAMLRAEILTLFSTFQRSLRVSAAASPKCFKGRFNCSIWRLSYSLKMQVTKQRSAISTVLRASMKPHISHISVQLPAMRPSSCPSMA